MTAIRTVKDLRNYLKRNELSPEALSRVIKISNMTIRRLLKKNSNRPIPEKYEPHFERLLKTRKLRSVVRG